MNPKYGITLSLIILSLMAKAQKTPDITGIYYSTSRAPEGSPKLIVLPDNHFVIPYFGGMLVGDWQLNKKNVVTFTPWYIKERFVLYGRKDPALKDSVRIYFQNFDRTNTYVGLQGKTGNTVLQKVFNEDVNCAPWPFVHTFEGNAIQALILADKQNGFYSRDTSVTTKIFDTHDGAYNDFIALYFKPSRDYEPFFGVIKKGKLIFSEDSEVSPWYPAEPLKKLGKEDSDFLNKLFNTSSQLPDTVFYNAAYNQYGIEIDAADGRYTPIDSLNYRFDEKSNTYINLHYPSEELAEPGEDEFHDERIIRMFTKLHPKELGNKEVFPKNETPVFYYTCDDNEYDADRTIPEEEKEIEVNEPK